MKKILFLLFFVNQCYGQNLYIGLSTSGAIPFASNYFTQKSIGTNTTTSTSLVSGSLSAGFYEKLNLGYKLKNNIAFELNTMIGVYGLPIYNNSVGISSSANNVTTNVFINTSFQARPSIHLQPTIKFFKTYKKIESYMSIGLNAPVLMRYNYKYKLENEASKNVLMSQSITRSRFKLGYTANIGLKFKLSNHLSLITDFSFLSQAFFNKSTKIVMMTETTNGVTTDLLPTLTKSEIESYYYYKLPINTNNNPDLPSKYYTTAIPYNHIALNLGLIYNLK